MWYSTPIQRLQQQFEKTNILQSIENRFCVWHTKIVLCKHRHTPKKKTSKRSRKKKNKLNILLGQKVCFKRFSAFLFFWAFGVSSFFFSTINVLFPSFVHIFVFSFYFYSVYLHICLVWNFSVLIRANALILCWHMSMWWYVRVYLSFYVIHFIKFR